MSPLVKTVFGASFTWVSSMQIAQFFLGWNRKPRARLNLFIFCLLTVRLFRAIILTHFHDSISLKTLFFSENDGAVKCWRLAMTSLGSPRDRWSVGPWVRNPFFFQTLRARRNSNRHILHIYRPSLMILPNTYPSWNILKCGTAHNSLLDRIEKAQLQSLNNPVSSTFPSSYP